MTAGSAIFGAILVGGRGTRLGGVDKARLRIARGGETLVERTWHELAGQVDRTIVVGRGDQRFPELPLAFVADLWPDAGPLGGLATALAHFGKGWCFVVACDLPRFSGALVPALASARTPGTRCVVPTGEGGLEPLCALFDATLHREATSALANGVRAMRAFIRAVPHVAWPVPPEFSSVFANVNTKGDLSTLG